MPGLWAQLNLSSPLLRLLPRGRPGRGRPPFQGAGPWLSPGGRGGPTPGTAGASPGPLLQHHGERSAPASPRPRGTAAGRGRAGHGVCQAAASSSTVSIPDSPSPCKPTQDGCKAVVLASGGFSTKCPPLRLRRSLSLAAVCICGWLVDSHQTNP